MQLHLAPIRGITDFIFRTIFAGHFNGFDCALAPFISTVKGKTFKQSHVKDILPENNCLLPVVPQIIGNMPEDFVTLSGRLFDLGYLKVNWNLGCPFPQVTKKKRGAGLLPYPERIQSFLDYVLPKIPNKLSVKTRLGLISKDEIQELLPVFNDFPIAEMIIHPRTGRQMYTGEVDLDGFQQYAQASVHPVVYNGDIVNKESFFILQHRFPNIGRWMIGRGAIANPLLGESLRHEEPEASIRCIRIKRFHDDLLDAYRTVITNDGCVIDKMKSIWQYLANSFPNDKTFLQSVRRVNRMDCYRKLVEKMIDVATVR